MWKGFTGRATRILCNLALDLRYGSFLGGTQKTRFGTAGAHDTANSEYCALKQIFAGRISPTDVLVDVGCGKGRVINWWLHQGVSNRIIGLELDEEVAARTAHRLRRHHNVSIIPGDAVQNLPADGTLFYLFNPFQSAVVTRFKNRILEICTSKAMTILYYNCVCLNVFKDDPQFVVEEPELNDEYSHRLHKFAVIRVSPRS